MKNKQYWIYVDNLFKQCNQKESFYWKSHNKYLIFIISFLFNTQLECPRREYLDNDNKIIGEP